MFFGVCLCLYVYYFIVAGFLQLELPTRTNNTKSNQQKQSEQQTQNTQTQTNNTQPIKQNTK